MTFKDRVVVGVVLFGLAGCSSSSDNRQAPPEAASPKPPAIADSFDYPVGPPDVRGADSPRDDWFVAVKFRQKEHLGQDWDRKFEIEFEDDSGKGLSARERWERERDRERKERERLEIESGEREPEPGHDQKKKIIVENADQVENAKGNADCGEPVYAAANGVIVYAQRESPEWGNVIIIEHTLPSGEKVQTLYGHLLEITKRTGEVAKREKIGTLGNAEGRYLCHLHFEVRTAGSPVWDKVSELTSKEADGFVDPSEFIEKHR